MSKLKQKPKWGKPKLIILTRSKTEERVLAPCKGPGSEEGGSTRAYNAGDCLEAWNESMSGCVECSAPVGT